MSESDRRPPGSADETPGRADSASASVRTVAGPDGRTVAYAASGDPAGDPVCLFHGTPGSRLLGGVLADAAAERGLRVLAIDRPGYGKSDPWRGRTYPDTRAFVEPVLDDADVDEAGVVGFSGGGPHALALAASRPERVTGVALLASAAPPDCVADEPRLQRLLGVLARQTPRLLGGVVRVQTAVVRRASPSAVVSQYTDDPDAVAGDVAALFKRDFLEGVGPSRNGLVTESRIVSRPWDVPLDGIDAPVRLWHGARDGNVPVAAARRFADRLPGVDLVVREDADHLETLLDCRGAALDAVADWSGA